MQYLLQFMKYTYRSLSRRSHVSCVTSMFRQRQKEAKYLPDRCNQAKVTHAHIHWRYSKKCVVLFLNTVYVCESTALCWAWTTCAFKCIYSFNSERPLLLEYEVNIWALRPVLIYMSTCHVIILLWWIFWNFVHMFWPKTETVDIVLVSCLVELQEFDGDSSLLPENWQSRTVYFSLMSLGARCWACVHVVLVFWVV